MDDSASYPKNTGLYDKAFEHDGCGVGFVANIDGSSSHSILEYGIQVLINLEHRGAVGGDRSTGDGAGLMLMIPDQLFRTDCSFPDLPKPLEYGAGMIFLPANPSIAEKCKKLLESIAEQEGCVVLGWREVPADSACLGILARSTLPGLQQLFLGRGSIPLQDFNRKLYVIRRLAEKGAASWKDTDTSQFYIVSLSNRTIVYKGLLTGSQLPLFYPDLKDSRFISPFALVHQRYSTNTSPCWNLAQPFRFLAHNGEINTLQGNINRMRAREADMVSPVLGQDMEKIRPVIDPGGSDSAIFDNVLELIVMAGRSLPHAMMMMLPEAYNPQIQMSEDKRAFYEFHSAIMEPWDGPAAMVFSDGRYIGATLDRNGLRPARYTITRNGLIVLASESGVLEMSGDIQSRGRLTPGRMLLVDLKQKRIVPDNEIKAKISRQRPYRRWIKDRRIELRGLFMPSRIPKIKPDELLVKQHMFGYTDEVLKMIIGPMASQGQEAIGSMGNDVSLAVLSPRPQLLFSYFKQRFAQVTNPPIDPLREELVMSLESFLGKEKNFLAETPDQYRGLKLNHPILSIRDIIQLRNANHSDVVTKDIDILFPVDDDGGNLEAAMLHIFKQAEVCISEGASLLILTDRNIGKDAAPVPSLLATSGLHHFLIQKGLRTSVGIIVESGEVREVMHFAQLIAYGADAVCPYIAFHTVRQMAENNLLEKPLSSEDAMDAYITAVKKGLLKTFSRMGISTVHSFFGSQIFEAIGISRDVMDRYFCGTPSRIDGMDMKCIAREVLERHKRAFPVRGNIKKLLDVGGEYHLRMGGEDHLWDPEAIYKLQLAARTGNEEDYRAFASLVNERSSNATLRGLFEFRKRKNIPLEEVESVDQILHRFVSSAMSMGSISKEAHEVVAIAMNQLGARSNSGEGGEDSARFIKRPNGENRCSAVKQVASGRFGVTTYYLVNAEEIQIKIAQGAKPGEGGQLPGHKVTQEIALVRNTTAGVTLISPPPHHDIYSIEDLAQLIYDLRSVNPAARISVKLVSEVGVGTVASGVAKAGADTVLISGQEGGTGASPLTAIKHVGLPWELGLAETQQTLMKNGLRDRIRIQVDGQLKTGRDVAVAALLGAEEFGFGTSILITLGCVLMRKCHLNTCPMGIGTQNPELRVRFTGKPEYIKHYLTGVARELREIMAMLGFRRFEDMIGHSECLRYHAPAGHWKASRLDLTPLLASSGSGKKSVRRCMNVRISFEESEFDRALSKKCGPVLNEKTEIEVRAPVRNVNRAIGTRLSGDIVRKYGPKGLPDDTIKLVLKGTAGQSLGAFLAPGITIRVAGDTNDYMGKGMTGGRIILVPPEGSGFPAHENVICGNVVLYGATGGEVYINGQAGERFAVRNSGATAVVEGIGDHGCEYMTGGVVVVIGPTGKNFAAGMSGGIAYVYDRTEWLDTRTNLDMVDLESVWDEKDRLMLHRLIDNHYRYTNSPRAKTILDNWEAYLPLFVKVIPIDYRQVLERMRLQEHIDRETVSATEEVFDG